MESYELKTTISKELLQENLTELEFTAFIKYYFKSLDTYELEVKNGHVYCNNEKIKLFEDHGSEIFYPACLSVKMIDLFIKEIKKNKELQEKIKELEDKYTFLQNEFEEALQPGGKIAKACEENFYELSDLKSNQ